MKAIIMAGGEGTRLKQVTGDLPKPMARLAGKPLLEHILDLLKKNGVEQVCLSLCYRPELFQEHFGNGEKFGMSIVYNVQTEPLGTAGGVKSCRDFYGDQDFLIISGDAACDFHLRELMEAHRRHAPYVTMALYADESPLQYGTVLTDARGNVVSFLEKPVWSRVVSDLVNTGIYMMSPKAMDKVPDGTVFDFARDLFPLLLRQGLPIRALPMDGYWCDIGTPRAYYRTNLDALDGLLQIDIPQQPVSSENVRSEQSGQVGQSSQVGQNSQIEQNVSTERNGQVGQNSTTGQSSQVGQSVSSKQSSQIGQNSTTERNSQVGQNGMTGQQYRRENLSAYGCADTGRERVNFFRELPCSGRARVMRVLSQTLMEAGADFSDGIRLRTREGEVHISPSDSRESLLVNTRSKSPVDAEALSRRIAALIQEASS